MKSQFVRPIVIKEDHSVIPFVNQGYYNIGDADIVSNTLDQYDWYTYISHEPAFSHIMVPINKWILEKIRGVRTVQFVFDGYSPVVPVPTRYHIAAEDDLFEDEEHTQPRKLSESVIAIDIISSFDAQNSRGNIALEGYISYSMYMNALKSLPYEPEGDITIPPIVEVLINGEKSELFTEINTYIMQSFHQDLFNDEFKARMIDVDNSTYQFKISKNPEASKHTKAIIWNTFDASIYMYVTKKFFKKISRLHSTEIRLRVFNKWTEPTEGTVTPEVEDCIMSYTGAEYGIRLAMSLPYIYSLWIRQHDALNERTLRELPPCGYQLRANYYAKSGNAIVPAPIWCGRAYRWMLHGNILDIMVGSMIDRGELTR